MGMAHTRAKGQGQRSLGSKVEADGRISGGDCSISRANAIGNNYTVSGKNGTTSIIGITVIKFNNFFVISGIIHLDI